MDVQQRPQLVAGGGASADVVLTQPDQGLQRPQPWIEGLEPAQPVPVGAQVVRQLVAVTRIGLGAGSAPAGPGGVESGRMHRDDGMAGGQQPVHHQPGRPFDDHRDAERHGLGLKRPAKVAMARGVVGLFVLVADAASRA
jgi:hypothetical protein